VKQSQLEEIQSILASASIAVSIDTETNYCKSWHERFLLGVSMTVDGRWSGYVPIGHQEWIAPENNCEGFQGIFKDVSVPIVFHNAKFDLQVLQGAGFDIPLDNAYCTLLISHIMNSEEDHSLDALASKYLGKRKLVELSKAMRIAGNDNWHKIPDIIMAPYAIQDSQLTYELFEYYMRSMDQWGPLWEEQWKFTLRLLRSEGVGLILDRRKARALLKTAEDQLHQIQRELGFDPAKTTALHAQLFGEQMLTPLSFTPKSKKPQVDDAFIQANRDNPVVALVGQYRDTSKAVSTYFRPYLERSDLAGVLRPTFNPTGTVTTRLSGSDPNMQQIPRDDEDYSELKRAIKHCFRPSVGRQLFEIDYRNMEYRLASVYADDQTLLQLFRDEGDFHQLTADLLGIPRQLAKVVNFLILYGGGVDALHKQTGKPKPLCKGIIESWKLAYPKLANQMVRAQSLAETNGYIPLWNGWKRPFAVSSQCRKAFNTAIQGGCMQIFKRSVLAVDAAGFTDIVNYVHDSIWINLQGEDEAMEVQRIMEDWTEEYFGLRFTTDRKLLAA
jgi:DNA polymerase-1